MNDLNILLVGYLKRISVLKKGRDVQLVRPCEMEICELKLADSHKSRANVPHYPQFSQENRKKEKKRKEKDPDWKEPLQYASGNSGAVLSMHDSRRITVVTLTTVIWHFS